ncbi:dihydrofolate reductase [Parapedobacter lycopersici]|uniref:dihydrofolate reductase n=1 Tax=Parapedobacter lycopersici TaxID=1864939 RepID=UPI0033422B68
MMMEKQVISIIVAAAENNAIGKGNQLLWHLPNDFKFFKQKTLEKSLIMGRKTFESLNGALPRRRNIVITRQRDYHPADAEVVHSLADALARCKSDAEVFIGGGAEIYRQALPVVNRIYLTRVHTHVDGDSYFVDINPAEWELVSAIHHDADDRHAFAYTFMQYERRENSTE